MKTNQPLRKLWFIPLWFTALCLLVTATVAETSSQGSQQFEHFSVHYSILSSTFLLPEVAKAYGIKRSKYESLINISVAPNNQYGGISVNLSGTATNLMQQQKSLDFIEIKEDKTVYYLAPIRVAGKELMHFVIEVKVPGQPDTLTTKFSTTLYAD